MENTQQSNPLAMFMRQPKIYISLPSGGKYWPEGSLEMPSNNQLAVYSMTARDELLLNIPDALMNGQAVVDVIQNCVPSIKNAWEVPSIDMDVILIAIRLATYGEMMTSPVKFGEVEMDYKVDLRTVMDQLMRTISWDTAVEINDNLTVYVKPISYKRMTDTAIQTFETQKIMQLANDQTVEELQKLELFKESFRKLSGSTIGVVSDSIYKVDSINGSTEDPKFIKEFADNIDKDIFNKIQEHLVKLRDQNAIKPIKIAVTDEMREQGITDEFVEFPLVFDPSTFFA